MTYMEHLQDNLRTYSPLVPLTDEENQFLLDYGRPDAEISHRALQRL